LAERQRLQAAFGTYVDPALAARLLEQGDDIFTGERRPGDRDVRRHPRLHPVREANTAEDTVGASTPYSRASVYLRRRTPVGTSTSSSATRSGGLWRPQQPRDHADAAATAAVLIHRHVAQRFSGELRFIGINTGVGDRRIAAQASSSSL